MEWTLVYRLRVDIRRQSITSSTVTEVCTMGNSKFLATLHMSKNDHKSFTSTDFVLQINFSH